MRQRRRAMGFRAILVATENDSGRSSAYASLITNVSRQRTSYRCFRLPLRGPFYLHHTQMLAYLEEFTDHFGLRANTSG